jgi:hypothetical protein
VTWLLFLAGSLEEAERSLRRYHLGYLYPSREKLQVDLKRMRNSMPTRLRRWHEKVAISAEVPPHIEGVLQWLGQWELTQFYEQLMVRDPERYNKDFHDAWVIFCNHRFRCCAEGMALAAMFPQEIAEKLHAVSYPASLGALDVYYEIFFAFNDLEHFELEDLINSMSAYALTFESLRQEAESKRYAVSNPFDFIGVLEHLSIHIVLNPAEMLMEMKMRNYSKHKRISNRVEMDRLSDEQRNFELGVGRTMAALLSSVNGATDSETLKRLLPQINRLGTGTLSTPMEQITHGMTRQKLLEAGEIAEAKIIVDKDGSH